MLAEIGSNYEPLEVNLGSILVVLDQTLPILAPAAAPFGLLLHPLGDFGRILVPLEPSWKQLGLTYGLLGVYLS